MQKIWISCFGFRAGQLGPDDLVIIPKLVWIVVMASVMRVIIIIASCKIQTK